MKKFSSWLTRIDTLFVISFIGVSLVYFVGLFIPVMEVDAAAYARAAMEMFDTGNYLEIKLKGEDWLDKPHMHFWPPALSFHIFGVNQIGYKFPAVLFTLMGIYYTYLFGKRFYSRLHGLLAALFLATAQHLVMANQDVRVEPYLTAFTIFALYYFASYLRDRSTSDLILGCFGLGLLLMTKGPFTIIPVGMAVLGSLVYYKQWKEIFNVRWILVGVLTLVFTAPTLIAYYVQFDMHPEKVVWGETNVSGVEFFLWTSQWGRFTNTGPIRGKGDLFFYLHTMFWAYAPWVFLAYFALFDKTRQMIQGKVTGELYCYFGFIVLFVVFSFSKFQLPHYLVPLFPLLSMLTVEVMLRYRKNLVFLRVFNILHLITIFLVSGAALALHLFYFDSWPHVDTMILLLFTLVFLVVLYSSKAAYLKKIVFGPAILVLFLNYYFNRDFYADAVHYQSESEVAVYLMEEEIPLDQFITINKSQRITDFVLHYWVEETTLEEFDPERYAGYYAYMQEDVLEKLKQANVDYQLIKTFEDFHVLKLKGRFVNKKTRNQAITTEYLIKIL